MNNAQTILEMSDVTIPAEPGMHGGMREISLRLSAGEQAIVALEHGNEQIPLADAAQGLVEPIRGLALFMGEQWAGMPPDRQNGMRGRIGRVFDRHGFVSNLNVVQNVLLSQLHHTRHPQRELLAEAETLARSFGLAELPKARPAWVPRRDLRRAEWVRALLGNPALLLLEQPESGVPLEYFPSLTAAVRDALRRGAAALWITANPQAYTDLRDAGRYVMKGEHLSLETRKNG